MDAEASEGEAVQDVHAGQERGDPPADRRPERAFHYQVEGGETEK